MSNSKQITAAIPGIFYRRSSPDASPFVEEGQVIKEGDIIGLVEVMKTFIEIRADVDGVLTHFLVEDEGMVEPGQTIAELEYN